VLFFESSPHLPQSTNQIDIVYETQLRLQKAKNVILFNIVKPAINEPQIALETANELVSALDFQIPILTVR
jgi:hypothetical protein